MHPFPRSPRRGPEHTPVHAVIFLYFIVLPETLMGFRCVRPIGTTYKCFPYEAFELGVDGRVQNWSQVQPSGFCDVTDPNVPRPFDCVCGQTCVVNECVESASKGLVRICLLFVCFGDPSVHSPTPGGNRFLEEWILGCALDSAHHV